MSSAKRSGEFTRPDHPNAVPPPTSNLQQVRGVALECVCALLLSALVLMIFIQVIARYVLSLPLSWSQEVVSFSFTWLCFLGAAVGVRHRGHIIVDFLINLFPVPVRKATIAMTGLVVVGFSGLLVVSGYKMMLISHGQATPDLGLPLSYVYASLPIGSALMGYYELKHIWTVWRGKELPATISTTHQEGRKR